MAGSPAVAPFALVGGSTWTLDTYLYGRLMNQVLPMLRAEPLWQHPLIAGAFDDTLCDRLLKAADQAPAYVAELAAFPTATGHGDACPNNLLLTDEPGFTSPSGARRAWSRTTPGWPPRVSRSLSTGCAAHTPCT
jgi:hypothetical protein